MFLKRKLKNVHDLVNISNNNHSLEYRRIFQDGRKGEWYKALHVDIGGLAEGLYRVTLNSDKGTVHCTIQADKRRRIIAAGSKYEHQEMQYPYYVFRAGRIQFKRYYYDSYSGWR